MNKEDAFLLKPGMGVDLVFNLDSLSPVSKSSIVFDFDESKRQVIVAQPVLKIQKDHPYKQMHVSSLIRKDISTKVRLGYPCNLVDIIKDYRLSNNERAEAVVLEYSLPAQEINIRSAFRFQPNANFEVLGKLVIHNEMYYSGRHFKFYDISISGIGILFPKKIQKDRNPLLDLKPDTQGKIGILLKSGEKSDSVWTIEAKIKVVRVNTDYNPLSGFAGLSMLNLTQDHEEILNRFIHQAQLYQIRKNNRFA